VHAAVDTLGHLLALHVSPASEQDRAQVEEPAEAVGGGARFRVRVALSAVGQGLRAAACHGGGVAL
jgi:hypothetical protein